MDWDHETELAATSIATTVYPEPEPEPGSGDDDSDGDQSGGTAPDRGTGTTTTATGRNLYTADGDRIVRTAPDGSITVYLGGQEITKAPDGSVTAARYYSFAGQTVAMRTANGLGGVTSLINDPHGTALASVHNTNWTTTSVAKHYTLPFGAQRGGVSAPGDHEFLGKVRDEATGLTLVGARWYDETIGKFLTVDPRMDFMDPRTWNGYAYANSNPLTYSDPTGLSWWSSTWNNAVSFTKGFVSGYFGAIKTQFDSAVKTLKSIPHVVKSAPREIVRRSASALNTASSCAGGSKASCGQIIATGAMVADRLLRPRQDVIERFKSNAISAAYAAVHGDWEGAGEASGANGWEGTKYSAEVADLVVGTHGLVAATKSAARTATDVVGDIAGAAGRFQS